MVSKTTDSIVSYDTPLERAENLHSDKDYTTSTHEKQTDFDKKRNYHYRYTNTDNPEDTELEEYKKQAQEMWNDSCTSPRKSK